MFVRDKMVTELVMVSPQDTILGTRRVMIEKQIRHMPVVEDGRLVGIVTDRDIRDAMPSLLFEEGIEPQVCSEIADHVIADIMTRNPITISVAHTLQDALLIMYHKKVGAFPVVDEEGHLLGIISIRDILKAFINLLNIEEPGTLLCVVVEEKPGQMKKVVDVISGENIGLGSVLVARYWDEDHRALFPYLLTCNVATVKRKLMDLGFELIEPMDMLLDQVPVNEKE
ncbi:MAG: CBS and ACT domain-containing protein [Desulforhopalus sp.]|nr:CBS and ACT domain-containing protein [Desulforhopalus sp.]